MFNKSAVEVSESKEDLYVVVAAWARLFYYTSYTLSVSLNPVDINDKA